MVEQFGIALFGVAAITLTQSTSPMHRRWAPVYGLLGQPFWFWSAYSAQQWGVFALCVLYTAAWGKGFYQNWMRKS